jgi:hypothetical protein
MTAIISPCMKPSSFCPAEQADDQFVREQRKTKLEGYVQTLAAMDGLIDLASMAAIVDSTCRRADHSNSAWPPCVTEVLVCMVIMQGLHNLTDEQSEYKVLDHLRFERLYALGISSSVP